MAMTGVLRPGHIQLRVLDMEAAVHHYRDILGMQETGRDAEGRVYLKCRDEFDHHSIILREADQAGMDFAGLKVLDLPTLDDFEQKLQAYGVETHRIGAGDLLETENASASPHPVVMRLSCMQKKHWWVMAAVRSTPSPGTRKLPMASPQYGWIICCCSDPMFPRPRNSSLMSSASVFPSGYWDRMVKPPSFPS